MCSRIPYWHFKEMLAIMSGKPHAICLDALQNFGQKNRNSGMFAWEYSAESRTGKHAVEGRHKFSYFSLMKHTLRVAQIVWKLLSECLAGTQRSILIFGYCFAYCLSQMLQKRGGGESIHSAERNTNIIIWWNSQILTDCYPSRANTKQFPIMMALGVIPLITGLWTRDRDKVGRERIQVKFKSQHLGNTVQDFTIKCGLWNSCCARVTQTKQCSAYLVAILIVRHPQQWKITTCQR